MQEADARFEELDPLDFAHFAAGQLLRCLLTHRPLRLPVEQRSAEVRAVTETVLSLLSEWQRALDHSAERDPLLPSDGEVLWVGYLAEIAKDTAVAVAYLDQFTGLEPDWQCPQLVINRPAMRAALQAQRDATARTDDDS
jgi:hypothetical protein